MTASTDRQTGISACVLCGKKLPRILLGTGPSSRVWECESCGASFEGILAADACTASSVGVVIRDYFPTLPPMPKPGSRSTEGRERRRHARRPISVQVPAVRLNDAGLPFGETFTMVSRDLSESGIAIFHPSPLEGRLAIKIELAEGPVQITMRIVRCKKVGTLYHIAGEFLERL